MQTKDRQQLTKINHQLTKARNSAGFKANSGEHLEQCFKFLLESIVSSHDSCIVCYRKHANEAVSWLAKQKMFGAVKKLGYFKGDLDFSITLKGGLTVFVEVKSGSAQLTKEQKTLIDNYKENRVPYFIFAERQFIDYHTVVATHNMSRDLHNIKLLFNKIIESSKDIKGVENATI